MSYTPFETTILFIKASENPPSLTNEHNENISGIKAIT